MIYKVAAAIALAVAALWLAYDAGSDSARLEWTEEKIELLRAKQAAEDQLKERQAELNKQIEVIHGDNAKQIEDLRRAAADSRDESDRVRDQLKTLEGRLRNQSADPATIRQQRDSATKAALVLSELLSSCSTERSELAAALDGAYARGRAVESIYEKARSVHKLKAPE